MLEQPNYASRLLLVTAKPMFHFAIKNNPNVVSTKWAAKVLLFVVNHLRLGTQIIRKSVISGK